MTKSLLLLLVLSAGGVRAQDESSQAMANPFSTPADRENGARVFLSQCASCHGRDGRGGQGTPDFTTGRFRRAASDEVLIQLIGKGVPGTAMPAFNLNAREAWSTLARYFLRGRSTKRPASASPKARRAA